MRMSARTKFSVPLSLPRERESCSPFFREGGRGVCRTAVRKSEMHRLLFPLPGGEGRGEGERHTNFSTS